MSQPEIILRAQPDPTSETPKKVVEVAPLSNVASTTVMHSVEIPSKNSSVGAFSDDFSVSPSHPTHGAEKINLSKAHETKLKPCNGNEESHRDFPVLKNPHKVAGSDHTNLLSSHQEQLAIMARDQAVNASNTCAAALAIPENVPLNQILSNLTTRNSEKATHELRETKIPKVGKRGKKNVTTEDNGGLSVHGNSVKSPMSRERKKSKYLSYPYIDPMDEKNETKDPMDEKNETKEVLNPKQEMGKAKMTNLASAELLTKLRLTAQSGSRKHSNQVKSFFLSFRTFAFLEKEDDSSQDFNECNLSTKGAKESSNSTIPIEKNDSDRITKPSSSRKQKLFVKVDRITEARDRSHWIKRQCMNALRKNKTPSMETPYTKQKNETVSAINDDANPVNVNSITTTTTTTTSVEGSKLIGHGEENSNRVTFVQLLNNVQTAVPNQSPSVIIQEDKALAQSSSNSNFIAKQSDSEADKVDSASYGKRCSLEQQIAPPGFNPNGVVAESNPIASPDSVSAGKKKEQKRKGRALNNPDDKTSDSAQNGNEIETLLPKGNPIKRRRKNSSESKVQNNSAAVILNFKSGFSLPSIESILQAFSGYGIINKSETRFVNDLTAQVVFILSASAKEACESFQNNNPFGPMIESFHFQPLSSPTPPAMNGINPLPAPPGMSLPPAMNGINPLPAPPGMSLPPAMNEINPLPAPPGMSLNIGESPNLMFIKHKLEMMKSMLEKGGNNLVPEMRARLESEVRSFSEKIDSMVGSSSS